MFIKRLVLGPAVLQRCLSRRSVERRVSRRLIADGLVLRKCSIRSRWYCNLGDYYLTRATDRFVVSTHHDLDTLAREFGVVREHDAIADD